MLAPFFKRRMGYYQVLEAYKGQVDCHLPELEEDLVITFTPRTSKCADIAAEEIRTCFIWPAATLTLLRHFSFSITAYVRMHSKPAPDPKEQVSALMSAWGDRQRQSLLKYSSTRASSHDACTGYSCWEHTAGRGCHRQAHNTLTVWKKNDHCTLQLHQPTYMYSTVRNQELSAAHFIMS